MSTAAAGRSATPGAAATAAFQFNDPAYRGWPVAPTNEQHPVRAGFLDPRHAGYHGGIDITVRDDRPEDGAPAGRTHRVYAVDGGMATSFGDTDRPCSARVVTVGHFSYGHVDPTGVVDSGQTVAPGQQIGWTCAGQWHVHLTEWQRIGGQIARANPLRPNGKLAPYIDTATPVINDIRVFVVPRWSLWTELPWTDDGTTPADPHLLSGVVDMRASISDRQSFGSSVAAPPLARLASEVAPYRLHVTVTRAGARRSLLDRDVFRGDVSLALRQEPYRRPLPFGSLYAVGTSLTSGAEACLAQTAPCQGAFWYRVFATSDSRYWDTTRYPNGRYRIELEAWDAAANETSRAVTVRLANKPGRV